MVETAAPQARLEQALGMTWSLGNEDLAQNRISVI